MKKSEGRRLLTVGAVVVAVWAVMVILMLTGIMPRSLQSLSIKICYYIILTLSLDLVVGYLGDLSLGHAAFYAVGGYVGCFTAVLLGSAVPLAIRFIAALVAGGIAAAVVGLLISSAIIKLRGDYLAIVTLAFGEFVRSFVKIIPGFGGTTGLNDIPAFTSKITGFTAAYAVMLIVVLIIYNFTHSRQGRTITAIRDNAIAAESVGIDIKRTKILVFTVSAFMAGLAGVIFGFYKTALTPNDFTYNLSIEVLVMVVLGGMGSIKGSIIASVIIVALPEMLRGASKYRMLIYAVALIAMMMFNASPRFKALKEKLFAGVNKLKVKVTKKTGGKSE